MNTSIWLAFPAIFFAAYVSMRMVNDALVSGCFRKGRYAARRATEPFVFWVFIVIHILALMFYAFVFVVIVYFLASSRGSADTEGHLPIQL